MSWVVLRDLFKDNLSVTPSGSGDTVNIPLFGGCRGLKNVPNGNYTISNQDISVNITVDSTKRKTYVFQLVYDAKKFKEILPNDDEFGYHKLAAGDSMNHVLIDVAPLLNAKKSEGATTKIELKTHKTTFSDEDLVTTKKALDQYVATPCQDTSNVLTSVLNWNYVRDAIIEEHTLYYIKYTQLLIDYIEKHGETLKNSEGVEMYVKYLWDDMGDINNDEAAALGRKLENLWN